MHACQSPHRSNAHLAPRCCQVVFERPLEQRRQGEIAALVADSQRPWGPAPAESSSTDEAPACKICLDEFKTDENVLKLPWYGRMHVTVSAPCRLMEPFLSRAAATASTGLAGRPRQAASCVAMGTAISKKVHTPSGAPMLAVMAATRLKSF